MNIRVSLWCHLWTFCRTKKEGFRIQFLSEFLFPWLFFFSYSEEMDGDILGRSHSITPCDIERTIALWTDAL